MSTLFPKLVWRFWDEVDNSVSAGGLQGGAHGGISWQIHLQSHGFHCSSLWDMTWVEGRQLSCSAAAWCCFLLCAGASTPIVSYSFVLESEFLWSGVHRRCWHWQRNNRMLAYNPLSVRLLGWQEPSKETAASQSWGVDKFIQFEMQNWRQPFPFRTFLCFSFKTFQQLLFLLEEWSLIFLSPLCCFSSCFMLLAKS